jgi:hypothetical protein
MLAALINTAMKGVVSEQTRRKEDDCDDKFEQRRLTYFNIERDNSYVRHLRSYPVAEESIASSRAEHLPKADHGISQR